MQEMQEIQVEFLGQEDPLEQEMATHLCSCLKNPTEEPGELQSKVSQRVGPDRAVEHTRSHSASTPPQT